MTPFARKIRTWFFCLPVSLILLALAGWGTPATLDKVVLQLPYTHQFQFAGIYAAQEQGYFREEGLEVEVRQNTFGMLPVSELKAGRAQYGVYQAMRVLHARLSGEPLVVMAVVFQHSPYALAVLRSSGIRNLQDLVGRRIALDAEFRIQEIRRMLSLEGVDSARVKFVPKQWEVNELKEGTADAMGVYSIDGPYDLQQQGCDILMIRPMDYGVDFYGDILFTNEQELAAHPARVKAMRRAILRGWAYALRHPNEMIDWILQNLPDRPKKVTRPRMEFESREVARLVNLELVDLGSMNPGRWRVQADYLAGLDPKLKIERLHGFVFQSSATGQLPAWVVWLGWGAAAAAGLSLLVLLEYYRLQRLVRLRTAALHASEERQRELFEQAPAAILVESYLELVPVLDGYRRAGITDLRAHLLDNPALVRELFNRKRVLSANRQARERLGFRSVQEMDSHLLQVQSEQGLAMFIEELVAIWDNVDQLRLEKIYHSLQGDEIHALVSWEVVRKDGQWDLGNVRLVFTDITDLKRAERAMRESEVRYRELFDLSPIALVEFDYRLLDEWFDQLRAAGVQDFRAHLAAHPELRPEILRRTVICEANASALEQAGATTVAELQAALGRVFTPEALDERIRVCDTLWRNIETCEGTAPIQRLDGGVRILRFRWRLTRRPG
ncbi:MAG: ABC transporter substrate-binding protein, partial [Opitutales bacterium]